MRVNLSTFCEIHTPIYVLEEERLRRNLSLIKSVAERADVERLILWIPLFAPLGIISAIQIHTMTRCHLPRTR